MRQFSTKVSEELEATNRQAAIAVTRAYSHTTHTNLLMECGLQTRPDRHSIAKSILFFKKKKGKSPEYLEKLLPKEVDNTNYNIRNSQDIRLPRITKNHFLKSFLPSSIRAWNLLEENMRNIADVEH